MSVTAADKFEDLFREASSEDGDSLIGDVDDFPPQKGH